MSIVTGPSAVVPPASFLSPQLTTNSKDIITNNKPENFFNIFYLLIFYLLFFYFYTDCKISLIIPSH